MIAPQKKILILLARFTAILFCLSALLFTFLYLNSQAVQTNIHGFRIDLAEGLGVTGLISLILIYSRSLLKISLDNSALLSSFISESAYKNTIALLKKLLKPLNQVHRYIGTVSVIIFPIHALLMGINRWNPFLIMVLGVFAWQGFFGFLLVSSVKSPWIKRYSRIFHAQLFTGVMIAIFAGFGHLLA